MATLDEMLDNKPLEERIKYMRSIEKVLDSGDEGYSIISSAIDLCTYLVGEEAREYTPRLKGIVLKHIKEGMDWYVLYRKILLIEAPFLFDSFMLYIEIDRSPDERFYAPRRAKLKGIVDGMQDLSDGNLDELFISQPPRTGKTTLVMFFLLWQAGRDSEQSILYSAYSNIITGAMYRGFLEVLGDADTYHYYDVFPDANVANTNAKEETVNLGRAKRYSTLTCRSLYGTLNGACDCDGFLVSDDLISGIEEAMNKDRLVSAWMKVTNNLIPRAKKKCKFLWIGTRWSLTDPIGMRLDFLENDEMGKKRRFKVVNVPALDESSDESNFDYKYDLGFDTDTYRTMRSQFERNNDMASWNAQYIGKPIEREGSLFESGDMNYFNGKLDEARVVKRYMAVDTAWGGGDFVSAPIAFDTEDGETFIVDWVYDDGDKEITRPLIVDAILKYEVRDIMFEANNGGDMYAEWVESELRKRNYLCTVRTQRASSAKSKANRIFETAPDIRSMYFLSNGHRSKPYQLAMNNLFSFTIQGKNKNDDAPDSLAMLVYFQNQFRVRRATLVDRRMLGL